MNSILRIKLFSFLFSSLILYILYIFYPDYVPVKTLKYISILLCFSFSFLFMNHNKPLDSWLVRIALFFTVIADFFLLVKGEHEVAGVFFFCIVQILYGIRLKLMNPYMKIFHSVLFRIVMVAIFQIVGISIINQYDLLTFITFFYIANLVANVLISFKNYKYNRVFAIGLFLFLCCDVFVGIYNSHDYITLSSDTIWYQLLNAPIDLMWFFYFPSQVLITISILTSNKREIVAIPHKNQNQ